MNKHTPTKWINDMNKDIPVRTIGYGGINIVDKDYMPVAMVRNIEDVGLITVAPELLQALKKAYRELNEIHARDGVPYTRLGYKASVTQECFMAVVEECRQVISLAESDQP